MAKNFFNRYVWLLDTIRRAGHISLEDISRKWELSSLNDSGEPLPERTFHNHRAAILDTFGIEIANNRSLGYYISDKNDDDALKQWMLESLSLNNLLNESKSIQGQILFERTPSNSTYVTDIIEAMKEHHPIRMTYQSFHRDLSNTFTSKPYCLKLFKQRWYMLALSEAYSTPRIYALDRILGVKILTEKTYHIPADFDAEGLFADHFGIIIADGTTLETINLKVDADQVKYFESLPLHHTQTPIETTEAYTIYRYRIVPTYDFRQELLSKGPSIEVLSPQWLRNQIKNDHKQALEKYE